jgi:hypothetical protein
MFVSWSIYPQWDEDKAASFLEAEQEKQDAIRAKADKDAD